MDETLANGQILLTVSLSVRASPDENAAVPLSGHDVLVGSRRGNGLVTFSSPCLRFSTQTRPIIRAETTKQTRFP